MTHRFPRRSHVRRTLAGAGCAAALALVAACSDSTTEPPPPPAATLLTVDASQAPAFVKLGDPATQVTIGDPTTSSDWDLSFFATSVSVNGGASGPGGVTAFCVCANANATVAQLQAMTPENQVAAFDAVTSAPPAATFVADALNPAISGWFTGSGTSATAVTTRSWIVRRGVPNVILAKFRVTAISGATATSAGNVTVEYAIQPSTGAAFGPVSTTTVNLASGPVFLDLSSGVVAQSAFWDVRLSGFEIRTNGGVSGTGGVGAVLDETTPFAQITSAYAASAPPVAYRSDSFGGVFVTSPWYRYNITGTDNQIWPNFNVYLVRRGDAVFKLQVTSYYGATGTPRQITVRSVRLQ